MNRRYLKTIYMSCAVDPCSRRIFALWGTMSARRQMSGWANFSWHISFLLNLRYAFKFFISGFPLYCGKPLFVVHIHLHWYFNANVLYRTASSLSMIMNVAFVVRPSISTQCCWCPYSTAEESQIIRRTWSTRKKIDRKIMQQLNFRCRWRSWTLSVRLTDPAGIFDCRTPRSRRSPSAKNSLQNDDINFRACIIFSMVMDPEADHTTERRHDASALFDSQSENTRRCREGRVFATGKCVKCSWGFPIDVQEFWCGG